MTPGRPPFRPRASRTRAPRGDAGRTGTARGPTSRGAEPCPGSDALFIVSSLAALNGENSRAKVQNVREDSSDLRASSFRRASSNGAAILEKPVSDRGTLEDLSQSPKSPFKHGCKLLILNGEMSEWSIEHAWKAVGATLTQ